MVNRLQNKLKDKDDRLSMRNSLIVWVAGAVLGWVVAVVSVWTTLSSTEHNIAENNPADAEQMQQIMPAAGDEEPGAKPEK